MLNDATETSGPRAKPSQVVMFARQTGRAIGMTMFAFIAITGLVLVWTPFIRLMWSLIKLLWW